MQVIRKGNTILIDKPKLSFQFPEHWLRGGADNPERPNIHLGEHSLAAAKETEAEWDGEYSAFINSVLDFKNCIAHIGSEGWGSDGISYTDLQFRAYILPDKMQKVKNEILAGFEKAGKRQGKTKTDTEEINGIVWNRLTYSFPLFFQDYGAVANIDFRFEQDEDFCFLFVFMYSDKDKHEKEIEQILKSLKHPV